LPDHRSRNPQLRAIAGGSRGREIEDPQPRADSELLPPVGVSHAVSIAAAIDASKIQQMLRIIGHSLGAAKVSCHPCKV
jgi:hypothetical protein